MAAVSELDFIKMKNLSSNGCIKTPLYRLIELRLTFGYLPVPLFYGDIFGQHSFSRGFETFLQEKLNILTTLARAKHCCFTQKVADLKCQNI